MRVSPAVLLLGQDYLALDSSEHPILKLVERKYGLGAGVGFSALLSGNFAQQGSAAQAWLDLQSSQLPIPRWLEVVASFSWSTLATSAIDSTWIEAFRNDWRQLRP